MLVLRNYQEDVIDKVTRYLASNPEGSPLVVVPTGGGKGPIAARIITRILGRDKTALYLTMTEELVGQTYNEVMRDSADAASRCSIACAGMGKPSFTGQVILGTIQTVVKHIDKLGGMAYVIVDEAQNIPRDEKSMYGKVLKALGVPVIHLTATPYRMDSGLLHQGPGATATDMVARVPIRFLQNEGYLVRYIYRNAPVQIDFSRVKIERGEFSQREMEDIAMDMALSAEVAKDFKAQFDAGRTRGLLFCVSIDHANMMADMLCRQGLRAESISSEDSKGENGDRRRKIRAFRRGDIDVLTNVNMVTTGFDVREIDLVGWARKTLSRGLLTQGSGRGSRPTFPGGRAPDSREERLAFIAGSEKRNCMLRDYAGNFDLHGSIEDIDDNPELVGKVQKFRKMRDCPHCNALVSRLVQNCPECEGEIISHARLVQQSEKASSQNFELGVWLPVEDVRFSVQRRAAGGREFFKANFHTADRKSYPMFIFFDGTIDRGKCERRWAACGGRNPFPSSAASAVMRAERGEWRKPFKVMVRKDRKGFIGVDAVDMVGSK